jgi:hypothetical protein
MSASASDVVCISCGEHTMNRNEVEMRLLRHERGLERHDMMPQVDEDGIEVLDRHPDRPVPAIYRVRNTSCRVVAISKLCSPLPPSSFTSEPDSYAARALVPAAKNQRHITVTLTQCLRRHWRRAQGQAMCSCCLRDISKFLLGGILYSHNLINEVAAAKNPKLFKKDLLRLTHCRR